jgi:hypothetical protein
MKNILFLALLLVFAALWQGCDSNKRYIDPNTGASLDLKEDPKTGLMVNEETGEPVKMYVDTRTDDTIHGRTGKVINGKIRRKSGSQEGKYVYVFVDEDDNGNTKTIDNAGNKVKTTEDEIKVKSGDYKKEVEKDGDITIKDGNTKIKIDGKTGKKKVKKDD